MGGWMRVGENVNAALRSVLQDERAYLLGEDLLDPYGGAFKISKGLSTLYPERVISTPISESGLTGVAAGLALAGDTAIVEIMFGDFIALAFDQIVNFASKSVSMYGERMPMRLIVRCPSGGGRGYGPTHSQSLMKHFIGVPGLSLYELSPLHDTTEVFTRMLAAAEPCVFFEDKVLYTRRMFEVPEPFRWELADGVARVFWDGEPDCVIIAPGGLAHRVMAAMRSLLLEEEINCLLLIPSRLYPFEVPPLDAGTVFVAEESTAGGTWGSEVAHRIHQTHWRRLTRPVTLIHSADSVIPTAAHLEQEVLIGPSTIHRKIAENMRG
jgi:pyruvate/2-oxoglutarate/acetoin dehydrogenase E1 component